MYGIELHWVNASPSGPTELDCKDARNYQVVTIREGQTKIIGRTSSPLEATLVNDLSENVFFPNAKVISRRHAQIFWDNDFIWIQDLGSTHGTSVSRLRGSLDAAGVWHHNLPQSPLEALETPLGLYHGDLIQFGKKCGTSESTYYPVRCYVRYVENPPAKPRTAEHGAHRIQIDVDDTLDSDSDVESLDAETFHASRSGCEQRSLKISDTRSVQVIEDDSEDEYDHIPVSQLTLTVDASSPREMIVTDEDADQSDSNSQAFLQDSEQHHLARVQELREEVIELQSESSHAQQDGENYMLEYRASQKIPTELTEETIEQADALADSAGESSTPQVDAAPPLAQEEEESSGATSESSSESDSQPIESISEPVMSDSSKAITPSPVELVERAQVVLDIVPDAAALEEGKIHILAPACDPQDAQRVVSASPAPSTSSDEPLVARSEATRKRPAQEDDDDEGEDSSDRDEEASLSDADQSSSSSASTGCTSLTGSPSPPKRQRVRYLASPEAEKRPASKRLRTATKVFTTVLYTTSLLSIGFLGGSIFTFKSMMNAAAQMSTAADKGPA